MKMREVLGRGKGERRRGPAQGSFVDFTQLYYDNKQLAECGGEEGGGVIRLKACKSCMVVRYCNVNCQKNHWPKQ